MRRTVPLAVLGLVLACASCEDSGTSGGTGSTAAGTVDLGGGAAATLGADGSFSITRDGTTVVATPPGVPLFWRTSDPGDPDGWHDPTQPRADLTTLPVDPSTIAAASESDGSSTQAIHIVVSAQPGDTALLSLTLAADSGFYSGLGEQYDHVSASGRVTPMFLTLSGNWESGTNDAHVPVPFLVSSGGWGLFVATREAGAFDVASSDPTTVRATFEGRTLDVWFFVDPDPLGVVARFNRIAGLPRPLPRWALSPIHWKHFASAADAISIATEYRQRHIPTSAMWLDDGWQTALNTFVLSPSVFGDDLAMMDELGALGYRVLAWTTPYLEQPHGTPTDEAQQLYQQADAGKYFVQDGLGSTYVSPATPIKGGAGIIDFTNAGARAFWENLVARGTRTNLHGFKCDYGEELIPNILNQRDQILFSDGTNAHTARVFPIEEHATYHAVLDAAFPGDGLLIVRASSWGGASQADVVWPGDLDSAFEHRGDPLPQGGAAVGGLPAAVVAALTLATSGFPAFGSDTAGYRGDPTRESLLRWMEHTALSVVMQVYEDGPLRLPWAIDDAAGAEYQAMASLHQQLEPYIATLMLAAQTNGVPPLRLLPLAFPQDDAGFAHADEEYMLGPDLLVAPVLVAGATSAGVHLPPGKWVHWWSDRVYDGPADVTVDAPLGSPALFARAGGLVPMLPPGIDTLVDASAPGVVTLASQAREMRARAWASNSGTAPAGDSAVALDDGASIDVSDVGGQVTVTWQPGATATNLTIDVDLRTSARGAVAGTTVDTLSGPSLVQASDASAVQASSVPAWSFDAGTGHGTLRFIGAGSARFHPPN
jgi:alpha-glucosidase (family GH31 glycosyl hydrolase)